MPQFSHDKKRQIGVLQILFSGFCFGFLGIFGKWAFALGMKPGPFLSLRFLLAALVLGLWLAASGRAGELRIGARKTLWALALGVLGYAVFSSFFFLALSGLSVSLTILLLYTFPLWVALGGRLVLGERLSRGQWLALPVVLAGLLLVLWSGLEAKEPRFLVFGLLSALFYAAYILASRRLLGGVSPRGTTFFVLLGAALVLAPIHLRALPDSVAAWAVVLGTAVVGTVLAVGFFLAGLQKILSAEASILSLMEPCTDVALAALFLHERLTGLQWAGGGLIFAGMVVMVRASRPPPLGDLPPAA
jgi:drug/metabolite transporter (DMT)-like permease